jgi:hypothetical protein
VSKDRAAPFSRKHRRYWIPVTGGMVLIGVLNILIGYCSYDPPSDKHERMELHLPPPHQPFDAGVLRVDASVAGPPAPSPAAP